jgi:hypothetical protein
MIFYFFYIKTSINCHINLSADTSKDDSNNKDSLEDNVYYQRFYSGE